MVDLIYDRLLPCTGQNRDLPSFPTRRSSDLLADEAHARAAPHADARFLARQPEDRSRAADLDEAAVERSEEHTSELQSRRDLVCRLLLEKKNLPNRRSRVVEAHGQLHRQRTR